MSEDVCMITLDLRTASVYPLVKAARRSARRAGLHFHRHFEPHGAPGAWRWSVDADGCGVRTYAIWLWRAFELRRLAFSSPFAFFKDKIRLRAKGSQLPSREKEKLAW